MEVCLADASHTPGIVSIPYESDAKFIISAVPDIRTFMEQQSIASAQVIYLETYEAALKFKEELLSELPGF